MVAMQWIVKVPFSEWRSMLVWNRRMMMEGLVCGLGMASILLLTLTTPWGETVKEQAGMVRQKALDMGILQFFPLFAVFISFFHSLLEEYYWRWFAFGNLHRCTSSQGLRISWGLWLCCASCGHHNDLFSGLLGMVRGIQCGYCRRRMVLDDDPASIHCGFLDRSHDRRSMSHGRWILADF